MNLSDKTRVALKKLNSVRFALIAEQASEATIADQLPRYRVEAALALLEDYERGQREAMTDRDEQVQEARDSHLYLVRSAA